MSSTTRVRRPFDRRRALIGSLTIVALLAIAALWQREHPFSIETSVDIDASPAEVWAVLSDLEEYPDWNPTVVGAEGGLEVGATLVLDDETATVVEVDRDRLLRWETRTGVVGILDGDRSFALARLDGGGTRFTQSESFRGVAVPFLSGTLRDDVAPGFHAMNAALRDRVEG